VTSKLKQFILNPQVTIYISEYRSVMVVVGGAVAKPGRILAEGPKTLLSVLMLAGGPQAPGPTVTVTRDMRYGIIPLPEARRELDQLHNTIELPLSAVLNASSAAANLIMQPDDVVSVSTQQRLVYILGEVNRPGAIELVTHDSISVVQVLAAAGGTTKTAAPSKTAILRLNSEGLYKRLGSVDLKGILAGKREDRVLSAGDVLVVPSSSFKMYFQAAMLSAATSSILILSRF
jgi:polysaccharide export outer membrane protein